MNHKLTRGIASLALVASVGLTGCQAMYNGQVLPSPYYRGDDVQYYAPGPEFKLAREAAAMEEARAQRDSEAQR